MLGTLAAMVVASPSDWKARMVGLQSAETLGLAAKAEIRRAIGASRIVMLGELTHGDGTSHAVKSATVQFLHKDLGFDVLVWESGFFDCWQMDQALASGKPGAEAARIGVFGHWSRGVESLAVFEYAASTQASGHKLRMAGFDLQPSGTGSNLQFSEMLKWFDGITSLSQEDREAINAAIEARKVAMASTDPNRDWMTPMRSVCGAVEKLLSAYIRSKAECREKWGEPTPWRVRSMESAIAYGRFLGLYSKVQTGEATFFDSYNFRERVNAQNLKWLLDGPFKGKKVIVWGHNSHVFRDRTGSGGNGSELDTTARIFGGGRAVYSIGFMAGGGKWSWMGNPDIEFQPLQPGSIESLIGSAGKALGFLVFRGL